MAYEDVVKSLKVKSTLFVGGSIVGPGMSNSPNKVWYVDGNVSASGSGESWGGAFKTIQEGVTAAGAGDIVYVASKDITDMTGDPSSYAETIIIPATAAGLSLIGVSNGLTQGGLPQIKKGSGTTALLTVRAPGCLIANLGFNGAGSTGGGILLDDDNAAKSAFGTTIVGCHFKNCKGHATNGTLGGAIMWSSQGNAWQVRIEGNRFYKNVADIVLLGTANTVPQDVVIKNNDFAAGANTDVCIYTGGSGFGDGFVCNGNSFGAVCSLGSGTVSRYTDVTGTGVMANNTFGAAGTTTGYGAAKATAKISTGILLSKNYSSAGLIVREA